MLKKRPRAIKLAGLGQILRDARLAQEGLDQVNAAKEIGCTQSYLAQIERGLMANPSTHLLRAIAKLYKLDYRDVLAALVEEKYGVDFTIGKPARNLSIYLIKKQIEKLDRKLGKLK